MSIFKSRGAPATVHEVKRASRLWNPDFRPLSDDERGWIFSTRPKVLTGGDDRPIPVGAQAKVFVCLLENGWLLANSGNEKHPTVRDVYEKAESAGIKIERCCLVPMDDIKRVYNFSEAGDYSQSASYVAMQKRVLDVFSDALAVDATDVKVVVGQLKAEVSFCINDLFYPYQQWDPAEARLWLEASFNMAQGSDATYKENKAQKARISSTVRPLPGNIESLRMQYLALARGGRALVSRLLKARSITKRMTMQDLGYDPEHIAAMARIRSTVSGVIVFCGPTGSGKSTSLVVSLESRYEEMNRQINILTIEDPAEYDIPCAMQTESVNAGSEDDQLESFNELFHAALRSKPHVIMVGEVRGRAAGKLLIAAAQSGHQVWTTIHASSALTVPSRMQEMGIERYLIRDPGNIIGIVFQRLLATLCDGCKQPLDVSRRFSPQFAHFMKATCPDLTKLRFHNPAGCAKCTRKDARVSQLGYSGQTVCAEVVEPTGELLDACLAGERLSAQDIWLARPKTLTAFEHGVRKMVQGRIDPKTVFDKVYDQANVERLVRDPERLHAVITGEWPKAARFDPNASYARPAPSAVVPARQAEAPPHATDASPQAPEAPPARPHLVPSPVALPDPQPLETV